jgi:C-terminal processing protease CtpA/Prc
VDGSSAAKGNLEIKDHIYAVNGRKPTGKKHIYALMKKVGQSIILSLYRNGKFHNNFLKFYFSDF